MAIRSPTLAGYITFIRNVMAIDTTILPDNSVYIGWSYQISLRWVNTKLRVIQTDNCFGPPDGLDPDYPSLYALAVYNLAGNNLVDYAPDAPGAPPVEGGDLPYFKNLRASLKIDSFAAGVVNSTSDEGTSVSLAVPSSIADGLTFASLQQMKTPWGRAYLAIAQSYGPSAWGLA